MPLGVIDIAEFDFELTSLALNNKRIQEVSVTLPDKGRPNGKEEVPESVRAVIASEALSGARPEELIDAFGTSRSSISAYKKGATSTSSYHNPSQQLVNALNVTRESIIGPAQSRLMAAIEAITPEKLGEAKVNIASAVARDMSGIIKNLTPESATQINNQVIVFKPRMKEEDDYEVIQVNE